MDAPKTSLAQTMEEAHPPSEIDWNVIAERVMNFIRNVDGVIAVDEDVWFFSGSTESQLGAYLRDLELHKLPL